jgi:DNA topoisomerase-1
LFEGINLKGEHIALITYIRTDSAEYAPEFLSVLENYVKEKYGKNYYAGVKKVKKGENEQSGHEAIRPVDLEMTPEKLASYIDNDKLIKVYTIIYKRTVASAMKPATISNTIYSIYNNKNKFIMTSKELIFDGYKKVYTYADDNKDEDELIKETFNKGELLQNAYLEHIEKQTQPPKRYNESSFIKELDKRGIGRPSTFTTILSTIMSETRGYCETKDKYIQPTEKGIKLSHFLDESFPDIINLNYTSELEKDLDIIANGKMDDIDFLNIFYKKLEENINKVAPNQTSHGDSDYGVCPNCGNKLLLRKGPYGEFISCSGYPKCKFTKKKDA